MATLKDFRDERLRKLAELRQLGVNPYPAKVNRTHDIKKVVEDFDALEGQLVSIVGRVKSIRKFGKLAFIVLRDQSGEIQLFMKVKELAAAPNRANSELAMPAEIALLDSGDFLEATGPLIKTQTGEKSVEVQSLRLLSKALRPMPSEQEGFTDKEQRLRRRYVDMNVNLDVRERFVRRSKFWQATRDFMNEKGFTEVNIPVLEHTTGGADANPFVTHMDALDQDFYLRISHELPLKRLIGAGFEKVYDVGPRFRNENYSDEHLPEHVAMEWYWAYADWQQGMALMEDMFRTILQKTFGTLQFSVDGKNIDMTMAWEQWDYAGVIRDHFDGLDVFDCTIEQVKEQLKKHNVEVEKTENIPRGIDKLWKKVRADVVGPIWLINTPAFISPLSKSNDENPAFTQRAQAVIAGSELCNLFSELNDPVDQLNRFVEQQQMRDAGDDEAMMLDIDYIEMLEYGMPPTCGLGFSERVFWVFEGVTAREGVPFPQLREELDSVTKSLYPEVLGAKTPKPGSTKPKSRPQDFTKRIVSVISKELEPWQVANAVAHMSAIIGNEVKKSDLTSGDVFVGSDGIAIPRNSQFPIVIKRGDQKELHKLHRQVVESGLVHHVFVQEMQQTTNDQEIVDKLSGQSIDDTIFYGVTFFATNEEAERLAKNFQLYK
jgi:lysyl-tRNA synthetase class 2